MDRIKQRGIELAKLLNELKKKRKLTYMDLMKAMELSWISIQRWTTKRSVPTFSSQEKIEKVLRKYHYGDQVDKIDIRLGFLPRWTKIHSRGYSYTALQSSWAAYRRYRLSKRRMP